MKNEYKMDETTYRNLHRKNKLRKKELRKLNKAHEILVVKYWQKYTSWLRTEKHLDKLKAENKNLIKSAVEASHKYEDLKKEHQKATTKLKKLIQNIHDNAICNIIINGESCTKCFGSGWCWWNELDIYIGPAIETGIDDTKYTCDNCGGIGFVMEEDNGEN